MGGYTKSKLVALDNAYHARVYAKEHPWKRDCTEWQKKYIMSREACHKSAAGWFHIARKWRELELMKMDRERDQPLSYLRKEDIPMLYRVTVIGTTANAIHGVSTTFKACNDARATFTAFAAWMEVVESNATLLRLTCKEGNRLVLAINNGRVTYSAEGFTTTELEDLWYNRHVRRV